MLIRHDHGEPVYQCARCAQPTALFEAASRQLEVLVTEAIAACQATWATEPSVILAFDHVIIDALERTIAEAPRFAGHPVAFLAPPEPE